MSPYYFPFVTQTPGDATQGHLTGYFDYRPKDTEEGIVVARSTDGGQSWNYVGKALEQNPESYCPTGDTNDNGQGHPMVMTIGGTSYLYTVNRPSGDNLGVGMLVHTVNAGAADPLAGLPASESVGTDPDTFANGATQVPATGGATLAVTTLGTGAETRGGRPVRGPVRRLALGLPHHLHRHGVLVADRVHRGRRVGGRRRATPWSRCWRTPPRPPPSPRGPTPRPRPAAAPSASMPHSVPSPPPTCPAGSTSTAPPSTASTSPRPTTPWRTAPPPSPAGCRWRRAAR